MHQNPYWSFFLIFIGLIVIGYTGFTLMKVYQHARLSEHTNPLSIKWSVNKLAEDNFVLQANYEFEWKEKTYTGKRLNEEHYLNAWATRDELDKMNRDSFQIWFDPDNPQNSTLYKYFPVKYSIYALILWLLFFYFIWLGHSMKRYHH